MPQMPEWTDGDGRTHRYIPTALPKGGNIHHPFYLDSGPLFLVYSGLVTADDDLMRSALHYFRAGPNTQSYDLANDGTVHLPPLSQPFRESCAE